MKYKSVSIYTMWTYMSRFLFLLIVPVLQQIFFKSDSIQKSLLTIWPSIFMISIIILFSFLEYRSVKYTSYQDTLMVKKGMLIKQIIIVPIKNINAITGRYTLISALFKSKKISFCVKQEYKKNDSTINLILRKNNIPNIFDLSKDKLISKPGSFKILLMSATWSNPLISLLIAIPFINKVSGVLGEEITKKWYDTIDSLLRLIKIGIPPLIASISYLLLGTFFVAVIIHFFKYANFKTQINDDFVIINCGLINGNEKIIKRDKINAIVIKQSLIMIILKLYSAYLYVFAMPKSKREYNLLFAALTKDQLIKAVCSLYDGNISEDQLTLRPDKKRLVNFLLMPMCTFFILTAFIIFFIGDKWYEKIIILTLFFIVVFILWWMTIRYVAFKKSKLLISENFLCVSSFKAMSLYYAVIPIGKIQSITIKRNPLLKFSNLCKVQISVISGKNSRFVCRYLDYDDVRNFMDKIQM